jgi:hypothetical protein
MYKLTDEDLNSLLTLETMDTSEVCKILTRACKIAAEYENSTTASDTLRIVIYASLKHVVTSLTPAYKKLMVPLEANLLRYCGLFTEK